MAPSRTAAHALSGGQRPRPKRLPKSVKGELKKRSHAASVASRCAMGDARGLRTPRRPTRMELLGVTMAACSRREATGECARCDPGERSLLPRPARVPRPAPPRRRPRRRRGRGRPPSRGGRGPPTRHRRGRARAALHEGARRRPDARHEPLRHRPPGRARVRDEAGAAREAPGPARRDVAAADRGQAVGRARRGSRGAAHRPRQARERARHRGRDRGRAPRPPACPHLLARGRRPVRHAAARLHRAPRAPGAQ